MRTAVLSGFLIRPGGDVGSVGSVVPGVVVPVVVVLGVVAGSVGSVVLDAVVPGGVVIGGVVGSVGSVVGSVGSLSPTFTLSQFQCVLLVLACTPTVVAVV